MTQILGGTRQAQAVSSLITQFQLAEQSMESMGQASGKSLELHNKMMDTAQMKAQQLSASWERFSASAVDSEIFKKGIDGLRVLVDLLEKVNRGTGGLLSVAAGVTAITVAGKAIGSAAWFKKLTSGQGLFTGLLMSEIQDNQIF
jgi:hypothetical protein